LQKKEKTDPGTLAGVTKARINAMGPIGLAALQNDGVNN